MCAGNRDEFVARCRQASSANYALAQHLRQVKRSVNPCEWPELVADLRCQLNDMGDRRALEAFEGAVREIEQRPNHHHTHYWDKEKGHRVLDTSECPFSDLTCPSIEGGCP